MNRLTLEKKYATVLLELAEKNKNILKITNELKIISEFYNKNKMFRLMLRHPGIEKKEKKFILNEIFEKINFS